MTLNLLLHCGAHAVERIDILNADTPQGTATHVPIPHHKLLVEVTDTLRYHNYHIVNEAHGMTADGTPVKLSLQVFFSPASLGKNACGSDVSFSFVTLTFGPWFLWAARVFLKTFELHFVCQGN